MPYREQLKSSSPVQLIEGFETEWKMGDIMVAGSTEAAQLLPSLYESIIMHVILNSTSELIFQGNYVS